MGTECNTKSHTSLSTCYQFQEVVKVENRGKDCCKSDVKEICATIDDAAALGHVTAQSGVRAFKSRFKI